MLKVYITFVKHKGISIYVCQEGSLLRLVGAKPKHNNISESQAIHVHMNYN